MAFTFGTSGGPAPAAPGGGFSFGGGSTAPAPSTGAFGSSTTTAAPAPSAFSFGGGTPAPAAGTSSTQTPAPASSAFSFGGAATSTTTSAPAPATTTSAFGGSSAFGGTSTTTSASAFGNATAAAAPSSQTTQPQQTGPKPVLTVPELDATFSNFQLPSQVEGLLSKVDSSQQDEARLAGQELIHLLSGSSVAESLLKLTPLNYTPPNLQLRQQLQQTPLVQLHGQDASLTPHMLQQVFDLASDLLIREQDSLCLVAAVASGQEFGNESVIDQALLQANAHTNNKTTSFTLNHLPPKAKLARDVYFQERSSRLQLLLKLLQSRLQGNAFLLQATDGLLQKGLFQNLLQLIRQWTEVIQKLQHEVEATKENTSNTGSSMMEDVDQNKQQKQQTQQPLHFRRVHLLHAVRERQVAAECVFYIAYHTQLTVEEIGALLDLVRDLSNSCQPLNPLTDVPHPYEIDSTSQPNQQWPAPPVSPFATDKDELQWQQQLINQTWESGQPQLLQCLAPLMVSVVCALDATHELHDRTTHTVNAFGVGNALLPPNSSSTSAPPAELQSRLGPNADKSWKRKDIWGLAAAAYSLLLKSNSSNNDSTTDVLACFEAPTIHKSFSFLRLTLLPALQQLGSKSTDLLLCDTSEFGLSVMADFLSKYLSTMVSTETENSLPISRHQWLLSEQEDLRLRRQQQVQERQFRAWSQQHSTTEEDVIPATVDLTTRPDCLDDIVAACTAVASVGPEYALCFWEVVSEDDADARLSPSRALLELERHQAKDGSLLGSYLSLLAALSNSEVGAAAVHDMLCKNSTAEASSSTSRPQVTWESTLGMIRYFAQELNPQEYGGSAGVSATAASSTGQSSPTSSSTAYYYFDEPTAGRGSSMGASEPKSKTSSASSSTKPKELGESNEALLAAHLALIKTVAEHCAAARCDILSLQLPLAGAVAAGGGGDEPLLVLFLLAIAPLSPQLRGAVFQAIASLLVVEGADAAQRAQLNLFGQNAWHYLESCQILPISLLDQYPKPYNPANEKRPGLAFPPSSTSLAASGNGQTEAVVPADPSYGIIYELDHVERRLGYYPSTEGFCKLLASLVACAGCPVNLGQAWRDRPGCTPYMEYVMNFVLPRASGTSGEMSPLPFRLKVDQSRLVSYALELVQAVLVRYSIPSALTKVKDDPESSQKGLLGIQAVVDQVVVALNDEEEAKAFLDDFSNKSLLVNKTSVDGAAGSALFGQAAGLSLPNHHSSSTTGAQPARVATPAIPAPKSPGFVVLADILSSRGGNIFRAVTKTLTDTMTLGSFESSKASLAYALYGNTPPTLSSAKLGAAHHETTTKTLPNALLKEILPPISMLNVDPFMFEPATAWREHSVAISLSILCAAAVREESFYNVVTAMKEPLKIVPMLKFQKNKAAAASGFRVIDVQPSRLAGLLYSTQSSEDLRASMFSFIGYHASSPQMDIKIASSALSVFFFAYQKKLHHQSVRSLCGHGAVGEKSLAKSFAMRLLESSRRPESERDCEIVKVLMELILNDVRHPDTSSSIMELSQILLGLPTNTEEGNWTPGQSRAGSSNPVDCFDAILEVVSDRTLALQENTPLVGSLCFELIFRLYDLLGSGDPTALRIVLYTAERLRSMDFFARNIVLYLGPEEYGGTFMNRVHTKSWLLKSLASELRLLVGFASTSRPESGLVDYLSRFLSPRPVMCERLLSLLLTSEPHFLKHFIETLPLTKQEIDPTLPSPEPAVLRLATVQLPGAPDVTSGYQQVDTKKLVQVAKGETNREELVAWANQWNTYSEFGCAAGHATDALKLLLGSVANCLASLSAKAFGMSQSGLPSLQSEIVTSTLVECLSNLLKGEKTDLNRGMDFGIYSGASCNLAPAVLLLVRLLALEPHETKATDSSDMMILCGLLSDTVTFSAIGDDASHDSPIRYERTSILGNALAVLLRHVSKTSPEIIDQCKESIVNAARSLGKYSRHPVFSETSDSLSVTSMLCRASLGEIIEACVRDEETKTQSVVYQVLSKDFCNETLSLLASLDDNIAQFLKVIVSLPYGAEILMQAGVNQAMMDAAQTYSVEEAKILATMAAPTASFQKNTIRPPRHLGGHIKLLSTILSAPGLSESERAEAAVNAMQVLNRYSQVFKKLSYSFPLDGEVLRCFLACLAQAMALSQPISEEQAASKLLSSSRASKVETLFEEGHFLENGIVMLCEHLSANPLPKELLPALPDAIDSTPSVASSTIVTVSTSSDSQTWWNVIESLSSSTSQSASSSSASFDGNQYEYAIAGADILKLSLTLLKRADALEAIGVVSFAQGLCRIADAYKLISQRISSIVIPASAGGVDDSFMDTTPSTDGSNPALEQAYLKMLQAKLERCLEDLLVIGLMRARGLKQPRDMHLGSPEWTEFVNAASIAMDHVGMDQSRNIPSLEFATTLSQQLRKELK